MQEHEKRACPIGLGEYSGRVGLPTLQRKKQKTVTREEKTYRKIVGDYSGAQFELAPSAREIKPYQLEAKETYQLNSVLTIEEVTLMQYCMRSVKMSWRESTGLGFL